MEKLPPLVPLSQRESDDLLSKNVNGLAASKEESKFLLPNNKAFLPPKKKASKKKEAPPTDSIEGSKTAQMMFKTSIRNHLDLSSLADNKANTMLSINTLIITVAMPLMFTHAADNKLLIVPMILLSITSLASMYFATIATRPIKVKGITTMDALEEGKADLFFFGNFCNMDFEDYTNGMEVVLRRKDILQNSIFNDLYWSGKALGDKFEQLRKAYTIFISGMFISIIFFVLSLLLNWMLSSPVETVTSLI